MPALLLSLRILSSEIQNVFKKQLNNKCPNGAYTFGALITAFSLLFFLVSSLVWRDLQFVLALLPYALLFAVCFAVATVTCVIALEEGSMALTNLVLSYSMLIPLAYSLLFFHEKLGFYQYLGVACWAISFFFTYCNKKNGKAIFTAKWVFMAVLLFFSNGFCVVFSRMQQLRFHGVYDRSFMVISLIPATLILVVAAILYERKRLVSLVKQGVGYCAASGLSNGLCNYLSFICLMQIPGAVYYPLSSAGGLVVSVLLSVVLFKERFTRLQLLGFLLGVSAMVLIN